MFKIASAALIAALAATPLLAVTPLTTTVTVNGEATQVLTTSLTASVVTGSASQTANGTVSATGVALARFDTANGILVGAQVNVTGITTSVTSQVTGAVLPSGGNRTVNTTTNLAGQIAGAGFSISNTAASASRSCSGGNCPNSPSNQQTSNPGPQLAGTASVASASLSAYAGAGSVTLDRQASGSTTVTTEAGATSGSGFGLYGFTGGTYSITYSHIDFAAPSFASTVIDQDIALDFGTLVMGSGPVTLNFSLFNLGNINSGAGLSLIGITRDNNNSLFSTTAALFTNALDVGGQQNYSVTFDPTVLGNQVDRFRLALRDFAPAGSVGMRDYELTLAVAAFVTDQAVVPEPQSWLMLIAGFGLTGAVMRRRRRRAGTLMTPGAAAPAP